MIEAGQVIGILAERLEAIEVPYFIGGSTASIVYGEMRTTRDVDVVIHVRGRRARELVDAFRDGFYVDEVAVERAMETGDCFNVIHELHFFQVDIFTPPESPRLDEQFQRRRAVRLEFLDPPRRVWLASPEDVILSKLEWYRAGAESSSLQYRDVLGILKAQGELDAAYMQRSARERAIDDLLARALADAGR